MSSRIKIFDAHPTDVITAPMPLDQALQWVSPHEQSVARRVEIFFMQSAYLKCVAHAASNLAREVGGVLIGETRADPERALPYIVIQDMLPARWVKHSSTHLTFTQDTLVELNTILEDDFPGKRMVGWFHTHPRLGIFLSSYDTWLHTYFFNDPLQVALVIDPHWERGGFFVWQDGLQLDPAQYVGFFELGDYAESSVVQWTNLTPLVSAAPDESKGARQ
ncbi:MAG: hypothetical protein HY741_04400 [Chloroflexi bacterium]|nr:hypothetical protein [Chloroflexota bacterium]